MSPNDPIDPCDIIEGHHDLYRHLRESGLDEDDTEVLMGIGALFGVSGTRYMTNAEYEAAIRAFVQALRLT